MLSTAKFIIFATLLNAASTHVLAMPVENGIAARQNDIDVVPMTRTMSTKPIKPTKVYCGPNYTKRQEGEGVELGKIVPVCD